MTITDAAQLLHAELLPMRLNEPVGLSNSSSAQLGRDGGGPPENNGFLTLSTKSWELHLSIDPERNVFPNAYIQTFN
jgi:hypothetical protein